MDQEPNDEHIIFKVCISCGFDTLQFPNRPRHRGPSCKCPECEQYTFVIACSKCSFESSDMCPLTKLLSRKHTVHSDEEEEEPRGRSRRPSWARRSKEKIDKKLEEKMAKEAEAKQEKSKRPENEQGEDEGRTRVSTCFHCREIQCRECTPGYLSLTVDMNAFSKTLAEEMMFCTMCEHRLCPGSELVVLLRCRDCGHEVCDYCACTTDAAGDEWFRCCLCRGKEISEVEIAV